ncbi:MAG: hypothetical protein ACRC8Z_11665 [Empedobacter falsenii]
MENCKLKIAIVNNKIIDKIEIEKYLSIFFVLNFNWLDFIRFSWIQDTNFYKDDTKNIVL